MARASGILLLVLATMAVGLMMAPAFENSVSTVRTDPAAAPSPSALSSHLAVAAQTTFPRDVLIETFTAEWCEYCPQESQALYQVDHSTNRSTIDIAELHVCGSPSDCGDNYVPPDNTSYTRQSYYGVTGYPTVVIDGTTKYVGALSTLSDLESEYDTGIAAAEAVPGNVQITQTADLTAPETVSIQASILSGVTGSFTAMSYLLQYIGINDSTGHDIGWVVRATALDQTVALTTGGTSTVASNTTLSASWDVSNLAVVTFVQNDSSKAIENANFVPVESMTVTETVAPTTVNAGDATTVTVTATSIATGLPLSGASVALASDAGGTFASDIGATSSSGTYSTTFTAADVTSTVEDGITATVTALGYTTTLATAIVTVLPLYPPTSPTALSVELVNQPTVTLGWAAPSSGGGGITYHVYRSTSSSGGFEALATTTSTSFVDTAVLAGTSYWYTVSAQGPGGFSANTSETSASYFSAGTAGLPLAIGWSVSIDSTVYATHNATLSGYLPDGEYTYDFASDSYGYLSASPSGTIVVAGSSVALSAVFSPRYATLQGTISPAAASVLVNDAPVAVVDGAILDELQAGTYQVVVSDNGYTTSTTTVVLTAGNTTTENIALKPVSPSSSTSPSQPASGGFAGLSGNDLGALLILVGAIAAVGIVGALVVARNVRAKRSGSNATYPPPRTPPRAP